MANRSYDWTPETDDTPPTAPRTRDEVVQRSRAMGGRQPAAAPQNTDAEAGATVAPSGVAPEPRTEPADTYAVKAGRGPRDVRAGPGDAGAFDTPTHAPERYTCPRAGSATRTFVVVGLALAATILVALFAMA